MTKSNTRHERRDRVVLGDDPKRAARLDDVNVVICSYSGDDVHLTLRVLEAASSQAAPERTILVDMSHDRRIVAPASRIGEVLVKHLPRSTGLGESRQIGLESASERYVTFLDSDALPRPGWLRALREAMEEDGVAVAGGPVLPVWPPGGVPLLFRTQPAGDFLSMLDLGPERKRVHRVLPGNMIVDRQAVGERVFPSDAGRRPGDLYGAEEIAMMVALAARGKGVVYVPTAAVDHRTRAERMSWRWMWRRVEAAGRESRLTDSRLPPLPRSFSLLDRAFLASVAIPYLVGRRRARSMAAKG